MVKKKVAKIAKKSESKKLIVMAVVLGLLIVVAGVQAVEMFSLKNVLSTSITKLSTISGGKVGTTGGSTNSLSKNLNNLPAMVGGC